MKSYDFFLISGYHRSNISIALNNEFKLLNKRFCVVTPNSYENKLLKEHNVDTIYIKDFFPKKPFTYKDILDYENKYKFSVNKIILTEQAYYGTKSSKLIKMTFNYLCAFEQIFSKFNFKISLQNPGGELIRRTSVLVADKFKVKSLFFGESFIKNNITMYSGEYKSLIKIDRDPIDDSFFQNIIENKIQRKEVIEYSGLIQTEYSLFDNIKTLLNNKDYDIIKSYIYHKLKINLVHPIKSLFAKFYYKKISGSSKYVFYPLNVKAESELFIRNFEHSDQIHLIGLIEKCLPINHKLIVKPHPGKEGDLFFSDYIKLNNMKNVELINPNENTYDIMSNASLVIISSSSVGLESAILDKKLLVLGNWPYTKFGQFKYVNDLKLLDSIIIEIMQERNNSVDSVDLLRKIYENSLSGAVVEDRKSLAKLALSLIHYSETVNYADS